MISRLFQASIFEISHTNFESWRKHSKWVGYLVHLKIRALEGLRIDPSIKDVTKCQEWQLQPTFPYPVDLEMENLAGFCQGDGRKCWNIVIRYWNLQFDPPGELQPWISLINPGRCYSWRCLEMFQWPTKIDYYGIPFKDIIRRKWILKVVNV